jgi:uncharacterized protein YciI
MTRLLLVFRDQGPCWIPDVPTRQQPLWDEHAAFIDGLVAQGRIVMGGPYADCSRALLIMNARDADEVSALLRDDPWTTGGILVTGEVIEWTVFIDARQRS